MKSLCEMDISMQHTNINTSLMQTKDLKDEQQTINLYAVGLIFDQYLASSIKNYIDPSVYPTIFTSNIQPYEGNENNIGHIILSYDRYLLRQECLKKQRKSIQCTALLQKPIDNNEINEWISGFDKTTTTKNKSLSTDSSTGFCLLCGRTETNELTNNISSDIINQEEFTRKLIKAAKAENLKNIYTFVPLNQGSRRIYNQGININFIAVPDNKLSELREKTQDNKNLIRIDYQKYQTPIEDMNYLSNNDVSAEFNQATQANVKNRVDQMNAESAVEKTISDILELINISLYNINSNSDIKKTKFNFSQPHSVIADSI